MLLHVRIEFLALEDPWLLPRDLPGAPRHALRADDSLLHALGASLGLPTHARHAHTVRILVLHEEVVEDIAELGGNSNLASAHAHHIPRQRPHGPVDDVDVVHVLLDDVIAGEPGEVEPVAALPLHLRHVRQALLDPEVALVPIALGGDDLADLAVPDALHHLEIAPLVTPLRPGDDGQAFLSGQVGGRDHRANPDGIDRHGLFHEDVFPGLDGGFEMQRSESGWCGRDDEVDVGACADLQVVVEPGESAVDRYLDAVGKVLLQPVERALDPIRDEITEGDHLDTGSRLEAVERRAGAAPAAADDANLDGVRPGGIESEVPRECGRDGSHGRRLDEVAPGD